MKIFISCRRDDSAGHTGRLYDSLEERFGDDSLFMDLSGIESGENFAHAIDHAVGSCDAAAFYMQSEGGASSAPVEFTAARVSTP